MKTIVGVSFDVMNRTWNKQHHKAEGLPKVYHHGHGPYLNGVSKEFGLGNDNPDGCSAERLLIACIYLVAR